jgi:hypothetical protein
MSPISHTDRLIYDIIEMSINTMTIVYCDVCEVFFSGKTVRIGIEHTDDILYRLVCEYCK